MTQTLQKFLKCPKNPLLTEDGSYFSTFTTAKQQRLCGLNMKVYFLTVLVQKFKTKVVQDW